MLEPIGYSMVSISSQEKWSISNRKPISTSKTVLNLKSFSGSVLALSMPNSASSVLSYFCAGNIFLYGNSIQSNKYKNP